MLLITHFVFSVCYDRNVQSEILLPFIMIINQACKIYFLSFGCLYFRGLGGLFIFERGRVVFYINILVICGFFGGVYCWYIYIFLVILQFFSITAVLMNLIRIKFRFYYPICIWKGKSKLCWDKFTFMPQNFAHLYACLFLYSCYKYIFFK